MRMTPSVLVSHSTRSATQGIGGYNAPRLAMTGHLASARDTNNGVSAPKMVLRRVAEGQNAQEPNLFLGNIHALVTT